MKSKYHSRKITVDGETFDSKKEFQRYRELQLLEKAGKIFGLRRQVKYRLLPSQYVTVETENGTKDVCVERPVTYIADFVYTVPHSPGKWCETVVEDCKGFRTKDYVLKRKMMLYFHGIQIKEV